MIGIFGAVVSFVGSVLGFALSLLVSLKFWIGVAGGVFGSVVIKRLVARLYGDIEKRL